MLNFIKRQLRPDGFLAGVASSFTLTLVFELLVGVIAALFSALQAYGVEVLLPQIATPIILAALAHVLRLENLALIAIGAIAWRIAPLMLKQIKVVVVRVKQRFRPDKRRVAVRPTPVTSNLAALKERLRRQRLGGLDGGISPA